MKVTIRYSGQARHAAGVAEESVDMPPQSSLRDLLRKIAAGRADGLGKLLFKNEAEPNSSLLIFVDDEQVFPNEPNALQDGEVVEILSPISGG